VRIFLKVMDAIDEIKALGLAAFINFMIYYIVGSLLIIISVNEVSDINNLDRFTK
jgi:hypothetical protein